MASLNLEQNSLDDKLYPTQGKQLLLAAHYVTGKESFDPSPSSRGSLLPLQGKTQNWVQVKGRWNIYRGYSSKFRMGYLGELVFSNKKLMNNYTASVLQAPAFTPTPHSTIVFKQEELFLFENGGHDILVEERLALRISFVGEDAL